MPSLIRNTDNTFGGNCAEDSITPVGYTQAPHDPPAGMMAPVWDDALGDWKPGTPIPASIPFPFPPQ